MDPNQYERAKALFLAACDQSDSQRTAFVDRECGDDVELRNAVVSLLDFDAGEDLIPPAPLVAAGPSSAQRFAPGDVFASRYRVVAHLGKGGMGEVYHAVDLTLDVPVALKFPYVTDDAHQQQLLEEVRLARSVTHPAVARIYDIGTQEGAYFVSMEYIRGDDLRRLLKRFGRMAPDRVADIGYRLCQGLAAAHEAGVLHRDVKPSNILIDEAGEPKLIDFGIATALAARSSVKAGTPSYMAPEQLDDGPLTEKTDLWSVGAVLYEMCTGENPYSGSSLDEIRAAHHAHVAPPSELGVPVADGFESALMDALSTDPTNRPDGAAAFAQRLLGADASRKSGTQRPSLPTSSEPERRPLTVLHCEVDDPGGRLDNLDPEELQDYSHAARREFHRVAARYEASIGDEQELATTIQFGFPVAHEDAAIRALLAALEIKARLTAQLESLDERLGAQARLRQSVHTGSAVVTLGSEWASEPRLTGNVFRIARQLTQQAEAGDVLVSADARRLLGGRFETQPFSESVIPGVHAVLGRRDPPHLTAESIATDSPLVGRAEELSLVLERVRRAEAGRGQVLFLSGDGGVGKSRLLREVRRRIDSRAVDWRLAQCSPYLGNTAFQPLAEWMQSDVGFAEDTGPAAAVDRFEKKADALGLGGPARSHLAEMASLSVDPLSDPAGASPGAQRDQVLEALSDWLLQSTDGRLPVVVIEDLHWADPSTLDLLERISDNVAGEAALVIATHRPEWSPTWPSRSHSTTINLSALTEAQIAELVRNAGTMMLDPGAVDEIVSRSDGIPLFAEELAKHASEPESTEIPATLRDSLVSRLDRMGDSKPVIQCAAVLGRDFDLDVLVGLCDREAEEVSRALDDLVRADFLIRSRRGGSVRFAFRHALLRDAAYSSLIRERRVALHSLALDTLRADGVTADHAPEILAQHAEEAGRGPCILEFRQRAAERATSRLANRETAMHAMRALEALSWQPSSRERDERELSLQTMLALALFAVEGFGSAVTERAFERARDLCARVGDTSSRAPILYGIFAYHEARADDKSLEIAEDIASLAAEAKDSELQNVAQANRGHFRLWKGDLEQCRAILETVWQSDDLAAQRALAIRFGDDPVVCSPATLASAACAMGDLSVGLDVLHASVERAGSLAHPMTLAAVLTFSALAAQIIDDVELCDRLVRRNEQICEEGGFPSWGTASLAQRGWIEIRQGEPAAGVAKVESAIGRCASIGQRLFLQGMRVFVAEGELALGRAEDAVAVATEAIEPPEGSHEKLWLAEAHRVRAEGLLALNRIDDAASEFRCAIDVARHQHASLFELRSAVRLAPILMEYERRAEARACIELPLVRISDPTRSKDAVRATALLQQM